MKTIQINLPEELARFMEDAVASGDWPNYDRMVEYAITTLRTETMLGKTPEVTQPVPSAAASPAVIQSRVPTPPSISAVDTTRQSFDSSGFMEGLVNKLRTRK